MDPRDQYRIPSGVIKRIGELVSENDKVIFFPAGNDGKSFQSSKIVEFYNQILNHPILSQRTIFGVNVCPTENDDPNKLGDILIKGRLISFKLKDSSNYPESLFNDLCLCSVGTDILSGWSNNEYKIQSGTSESAPSDSSIAAVVKQEFPKLSGIQVIQKIKDTSIPLGDSKLRYVWAPAALGLEDE